MMNVHLRVTCAITILIVLLCCTSGHSKQYPLKKILKKTDPIFPGRLASDPNLTLTRIEAGLLQVALMHQLNEVKNNSSTFNKTLQPASCGFPFYERKTDEF